MKPENQGTHAFWLGLGVALAAVSCGSASDQTGVLGATAGTSASSSNSTTSTALGSSSSAQPAGGAGRAAATSGGAGMLAAMTASQAGSGATPPSTASLPMTSTMQAGSSAGSQAGSAGGAAGSTDAGSGGSAMSAAGTSGGSGVDPSSLDKFSFFVTSFAGLQRLSGSEKGFGGDLRYGEADGLSGADKICSELAEASMEGASAKGWRAFLSVAHGPGGGAVDAIDRIGEGPWYDRLGRVLAMNKSALLNTRPEGADPAIVNDFPNEDGVPNQTPDPSMGPVNNHHFLTGSDAQGRLYKGSVASTCDDWTTTDSGAGRPRIGFSYPAGNRQHWISGQDEGGCGAGAVLVDRGGSDPSNPIVGSGGGYGGFYCFALMP